jgi:hypothetical protein
MHVLAVPDLAAQDDARLVRLEQTGHGAQQRGLAAA